MAYEPTTKVAKDLGIPRSTLNYWIKKEWSEQRKLRGTEALETVSSLHMSTIQQITKDLIIVASRAAAEQSRSNELTLKDAETAMKILDNIQGLSDRFKAEEEKQKQKQERIAAPVHLDPFAVKEGE
jgi:transposase-like protein